MEDSSHTGKRNDTVGNTRAQEEKEEGDTIKIKHHHHHHHQQQEQQRKERTGQDRKE